MLKFSIVQTQNNILIIENIFMNLIITITFVVFICYLIAEFFGRAKHIGFGWSFALLISGLIPGIISIICSPSAKDNPTKINNKFVIFEWIFLVFAIFSSIKLLPITIPFFVLAAYFDKLSKGQVINNKPKYYFNKPSKETQIINSRISQKEKDLQSLNESGILTNKEYEEKLEKIRYEDFENRVKNCNDYKILKNFFDEKYITEFEFNEKIEIIKSKLVKNFPSSQ
jgi:hypothetical protein